MCTLHSRFLVKKAVNIAINEQFVRFFHYNITEKLFESCPLGIFSIGAFISIDLGAFNLLSNLWEENYEVLLFVKRIKQ